MKKLFLPFTLAALVSYSAHADTLNDAQRHFDAVASGQLEPIMQDYAEQATLNWVGGPLDGTYHGMAAIQSVWAKFTQAQGPLNVSVSNLEESGNPQGSTVSADVRYSGKQAITVRYVLTYRDNQIVSETWQVVPVAGAQKK